jgi:hypothetical protein
MSKRKVYYLPTAEYWDTKFDDLWREADDEDIEEYGTYDS